MPWTFALVHGGREGFDRRNGCSTLVDLRTLIVQTPHVILTCGGMLAEDSALPHHPSARCLLYVCEVVSSCMSEELAPTPADDLRGFYYGARQFSSNSIPRK